MASYRGHLLFAGALGAGYGAAGWWSWGLDWGPVGLAVGLTTAGGVMLGFLSHLALDELYSVDFNGVRLRLNKYAGSALKLTSPSVPATVAAYAVLAALSYLAWLDPQTQQVIDQRFPQANAGVK